MRFTVFWTRRLHLYKMQIYHGIVRGIFGSDLSIERREAEDSDHLIEICDVDILSPAGVPIASYDESKSTEEKKTAIRGESDAARRH